MGSQTMEERTRAITDSPAAWNIVGWAGIVLGVIATAGWIYLLSKLFLMVYDWLGH